MNERLSFRFMNASGTATHPVVLLGDRNIAGNVSRVEFESSVGDVPHVVLTMPLIKGATLDLAGAIVEVSSENRELLVELGWTPPESAAGAASDPIPSTDLVEAMAEAERSSGMRVHIDPTLLQSGGSVDPAMVELLRKYIRSQGGDVQKALGS
jgi:hypothetical protein